MRQKSGRGISKDKRSGTGKRSTPAAAPARTMRWELWALLLLAVATLIAYLPALRGPFLFDDFYLPFAEAPTAALPLAGWLRGSRPLTMLSYWVNYQLSGLDPLPYHLTGLLFHLLAGGMVFVILRRLLELVDAPEASRKFLPGFGAGLFLLHPAQTEAVAYVASRSENLSVFFGLAALAVFLNARAAELSWPRALAVASLLGLGILAKEHIVAVVGVIVLAAWMFRPPADSLTSPLRRNGRLFTLLAITGAGAAALVFRVMQSSLSAGFGLKDASWSDYLFTQFRVIWIYLRLFVAPFGQNADYALPFSRSLAEPAVLAGLAGLLVVSFLAIWKRRQYPLAAFGWFAFLLLLAPTSSIVPIQDALAERRLYLPMIGLLCIVSDLLPRLRLSPLSLRAAGVAVLLVVSILTWQRSHLWASELALWEDTVAKSPHNWRAHSQLGYALLQNGRCREAVAHLEKAVAGRPEDAPELVNLALAYDCLNEHEKAVERLNEAARLLPSAHVYSQIGMIRAKQRKRAEALAALERAIQLDANFDATYLYLGHLEFQSGNPAAAAEHYRKALALNPANDAARRALVMAERQSSPQAKP